MTLADGSPITMPHVRVEVTLARARAAAPAFAL